MSYRLDFYIEREFYDDSGGKDIYMAEVKLSGNGITDTVCIQQDTDCIIMTKAQAIKLRELLERVR